MIYEYNGELFPDYLKTGNACRFIAPVAETFCQGRGLDVGAGKWPLKGAMPVELKDGGDAMDLPEGKFDYIFSSHCLEHLENPVAALKHWKERLRFAGVLFLYLPHPEMSYWLPQNCQKHLHSWAPASMARLVSDLGFKRVIHSQRDMYWSFSVVGFNG
jgi:SAM-dependent methyltransferase